MRPALPPGRAHCFGALPAGLAPLLSRPDQAVFLLLAPEFRHGTRRARFAGPARARTDWPRTPPSTPPPPPTWPATRLRASAWAALRSRPAAAAGH
ncbi:hypothetical protein ACFV1W_28970 [Kitasatospora sp. NPDC059648]|uniref:hypothetical protein n=1 Tax=Kitasatospora sp. NPDC059648 TaxID=3346894 RepID=UPI0036A9EA35